MDDDAEGRLAATAAEPGADHRRRPARKKVADSPYHLSLKYPLHLQGSRKQPHSLQAKQKSAEESQAEEEDTTEDDMPSSAELEAALEVLHRAIQRLPTLRAHSSEH